MEINPLRIPVTSMAGIAAFIIFFSLAVASALQYEGRQVLNILWLDDLGNTNLNPAGAAYFNTACILAGLLLILFYLGLIRWHGDDLLQNVLIGAGQLSGVASGAALFAAGMQPALYGPEHYLWTTAFIGGTAAALLFLTAALLMHLDYSKMVLLAGILAMTVSMLALIARLLALDVGVADLIATVLAFVWVGAFSWNTYSQFAGD